MAFAIVTGASAGIGKELSRICARAGYDLVLVARDRERLEQLASEIRERAKKVLVIAKDLSHQVAPSELYEELSSIRGDVEILINNAGFGLRGFFVDLDCEQQMEMLRLNCEAL